MELRDILSVFSRPQTPEGMKSWDALFERGFIDRNGSVLPEHREHVAKSLGWDEFDGSNKGIFHTSPVKDLRRFYGDSRRHLNSELPNSSIGRLLGVSELEANNDEDEDAE
jgi:hypothetical protein